MPRRTLIQQSRAKSSKQKAQYHEFDGVGKKRVTREFFGLNRTDEDAIVDRLNRYLDDLAKG